MGPSRRPARATSVGVLPAVVLGCMLVGDVACVCGFLSADAFIESPQLAVTAESTLVQNSIQNLMYWVAAFAVAVGVAALITAVGMRAIRELDALARSSETRTDARARAGVGPHE